MWNYYNDYISDTNIILADRYEEEKRLLAIPVILKKTKRKAKSLIFNIQKDKYEQRNKIPYLEQLNETLAM